MTQDSAPPILDVRELTTVFHTSEGPARAVDRVDLSLFRNETLAVMGESGCGKSVLALSIMGLVPDPPGRVVNGQVLYRGQDLTSLSEREMRAVRGNHLAMIFQEPMTSLNPVFKVGEQIAEGIRLHQGLGAREALERAVEMLALVGIPNPDRRAASYPHEMSGGMRQRVMIAMALCCDPDILIADEPTTALDVTIQAQILDLMEDIKAKKDASIMLITHDPGVVAGHCDRVAVMYAGRVVELSDVRSLFSNPLHPYTVGIMDSVPRPGSTERLRPIPGNVPPITALPPGCPFHPRCSKAFEGCDREEPPMFEPEPGRFVRCRLYR